MPRCKHTNQIGDLQMSTHSFEIDVNEVLTEDLKVEIIKDEYRRAMRQVIQVDKERILNNAAYTVVQKLVDDIFDEDLNTILKEKVTQIIGDLSTFNVFRGKNAWDCDESKGWVYLQESIESQKENIHSRVQDIVESYLTNGNREKMIHEAAQEAVYNVISDKLTGKN